MERIICADMDCWLLHDEDKWRTIRKIRRHTEATGHKRWIVNGDVITSEKLELAILREER